MRHIVPATTAAHGSPPAAPGASATVPARSSSTHVLRLVAARAALFDRLPVAVRAVVRLCDGTRGVGEVLALSPLQAADAHRVVERLLQLGLVVAELPAPQRRRSLTPQSQEWARHREGAAGAESAFSADEEAFFASGIDHLVDDDFYE